MKAPSIRSRSIHVTRLSSSLELESFHIVLPTVKLRKTRLYCQSFPDPEKLSWPPA